jgi:hypothetical protein
MKSVVDSSHTHHHHTTSPTGRLDKITNPLPSMCCATRNKHPHGAPCTRRRNQKWYPNGTKWRMKKDNFYWGSTFWQSNERAGWTYTTTSARLAGRRMLFPLPPCRVGKTLSTADTHTLPKRNKKYPTRLRSRKRGHENLQFWNPF